MALGIQLKHQMGWVLKERSKQLQGLSNSQDLVVDTNSATSDSLVSFDFHEQLTHADIKLREFVDTLPPNIAICSLIMNPGKTHLIVTRLESARQPVIVRIPLVQTEHDEHEPFSTYDFMMTEFKSVMRANDISTSDIFPTMSKKEWWENREQIDQRLKNLLLFVNNVVLGPWKALLLGAPYEFAATIDAKLAKIKTKLDDLMLESNDTAGLDAELLRLLLLSTLSQTCEELQRAIIELCGWTAEQLTPQQQAKLRDAVDLLRYESVRLLDADDETGTALDMQANKLEDADNGDPPVITSPHVTTRRRGLRSRAAASNTKTTTGARRRAVGEPKIATTPTKNKSRQHLVLILDKCIQQIPWEGIPYLQGESVSRMPSLAFVGSYLQMLRHQTVVDPRDTFYILNPSGDLKKTQVSFEDLFTIQPGWNGITAQSPTAQQFQYALTEHDLFIYCGHGSGQQYLSAEKLRRLNRCATSILMGCSSGKLDENGDHFEPTGMALNYLLAGCPCVVGNLWDVTDVDIDKFAKQMFELWLGAAGEGINSEDDESDDSSSSRQKTGARNRVGSLPVAAMNSRAVCKLQHINGCAPVCYGLPVSIVR